MFHRSVVSALQSVGARVIDLGLTTTPTCQLAVEHHHAGGGLMISASHNPVEWNALKFVASTGLFLDAAEGAAMRAGRPAIPARDVGSTRHRRGRRRGTDAAHRFGPGAPGDRHRAHSRAKAACRARCCRGAGAVIMPALLERLGCQVTVINLEPDGRFPRPPEPVAENLGELERWYRARARTWEFAVDPDVDRLAIVANDGHAIGEDYTLALAAESCSANGRARLSRTCPRVVSWTTSLPDQAAAWCVLRLAR
jgi:phosphomannomutase